MKKTKQLPDDLNNINLLLAEIAEKEKLISDLEKKGHGMTSTKDNYEQIVEMETKFNDELFKIDAEILQLTNKCDEIKKNFYGSYEYFLPPLECISQCNIELVNGAPAKSITGNEEYKYIDKFMERLKETNPKPERIVLSGHSRGASTCIELARQIYIEYGNAIKMDMNLSDPVPGPLKHTESKKMIPPNVESLTLAYAGKEANFLLFPPQNVNKLVYDKNTTAFTAVVLPGTHQFPSPDVKIINESFWNTVIKGEAAEKIEATPSSPYKIEKHRRKRIGSISSMPDKQDKKVKDFHQMLQATYRTDHIKAESAVSKDEEKVEFNTPEKRAEQLKKNYKLSRSQELSKASDSKESSGSEDSLHKSKKLGKK